MEIDIYDFFRYGGFYMEELMGRILVFLGIILVVLIIIYVLQAILLTKLNKLMYGKGTPMAWIPIANIYLLGKLTINKLVGWILVICCFSTGTVTTTVNGESTTTTLLPESIGSIVSIVYSISVFALFIYAIIKYFKLKKEQKLNYNYSNNSTTTSNDTSNLSTNTMTTNSGQQPSNNVQVGVQTHPAAPASTGVGQSVQQPTTDSSQNQSVQNSDPFNW